MARPGSERSSAALRAEIATRAARLIAEGHMNDMAQAKRKAAHQLGVTNGRALPSNQEIGDALNHYRAIYNPEHPALLRALRQKAVYLLHFFAAYRPYLTGSVLSGAAGEHSNINLLLYHDDPKAVEFFLLDQQIDYQHNEGAGIQHVADYPTLAFWYDETPVLLHVRPLSAERNAGHREDRATLAEVEHLLASAA